MAWMEQNSQKKANLCLCDEAIIGVCWIEKEPTEAVEATAVVANWLESINFSTEVRTESKWDSFIYIDDELIND